MKDVMSFRGAVAFHRAVIPNLSRILAPLTELTKGVDHNTTGSYKMALETTLLEDRWGDKEEEAFEIAKTKVATAPAVLPPIYDFDKPVEFYLATDASSIGYGVHLCQKPDSGVRIIMYASKKNTDAEKRGKRLTNKS